MPLPALLPALRRGERGMGVHSVRGYPIPSAIVFFSFRFVPDSVSPSPIRFPFFRYRAAAITRSLGSHPSLGGLIPTCSAACGAMNSAISLSLFS